MINGLPPATAFLLGVNVFIHVVVFLSSANLNDLSIAAAPVLERGEWYRLLSSAFVHGGFFHILMNMMSLMQLAPALEQQFGTLPFAAMTAWTIIIEGLLYVSISWLGGTATGDIAWMYHAGVGFSGVLFTYATLESYHTTMQFRSVFGFFSVPAKVYPWILLVLLSVVLPGISFLGHLCGILSGMLFIIGAMDVLLPSSLFLRHVEDFACLRYFTRMETFSRAADKSFTAPDAGGEGGGGLGGIVFTALLYVCYLLETVLVCCGLPVDLAARLRACSGGCTGPGACFAAGMSWLRGLMGGGGAGYTPPWQAPSTGPGYSAVQQGGRLGGDDV
jgi:membrane associated rhomboid family serine protease